MPALLPGVERAGLVRLAEAQHARHDVGWVTS